MMSNTARVCRASTALLRGGRALLTIALVVGMFASLTGDDNIVFDAASGWAHPECGLGEVEITEALPMDYPIGAE